MPIGLILTALFLFASIITFFIFIIRIIFEIINKDKKQIKKNIIYLFITLLVMIILSGAGAYNFFRFVYDNREEIVDFTVDALDAPIRGASGIFSKSLRYTADDLWNNWDNEFVSQLANVDIEISEVKAIESGDSVIYDFLILFRNKNTTNSRISFYKLFNNNYLVAADQNDNLYSFVIFEDSYDFASLPKGKSEAAVSVKVRPGIEIKYIRWVEQKIKID